jgi:uncharacterized membrane protein YjjP (DUF1212 family)
MSPEPQNVILQKETSLKDETLFLSQYASMLMGSGVHTSRVVRNTKRIGDALGKEVKIGGTHKSLMLSATDKETGESLNTLAEVPPCPISFEINTSLSRLSWDAYDEHWTFEKINKRYTHLVNKPKMHPIVVLILASFANASFCALFGGDWFSKCVVFSATLIGMFARQRMQAKKVNPFITVVLSAFIASLIASTSVVFNTTYSIALATSVLFLIPGVPLINGFIDIMEGYIIIGMARLLHAFLLVLCIAIGMSGTIILLKDNLLQ